MLESSAPDLAPAVRLAAISDWALSKQRIKSDRYDRPIGVGARRYSVRRLEGAESIVCRLNLRMVIWPEVQPQRSRFEQRDRPNRCENFRNHARFSNRQILVLSVACSFQHWLQFRSAFRDWANWAPCHLPGSKHQNQSVAAWYRSVPSLQVSQFNIVSLPRPYVRQWKYLGGSLGTLFCKPNLVSSQQI